MFLQQLLQSVGVLAHYEPSDLTSYVIVALVCLVIGIIVGRKSVRRPVAQSIGTQPQSPQEGEGYLVLQIADARHRWYFVVVPEVPNAFGIEWDAETWTSAYLPAARASGIEKAQIASDKQNRSQRPLCLQDAVQQASMYAGGEAGKVIVVLRATDGHYKPAIPGPYTVILEEELAAA